MRLSRPRTSALVAIAVALTTVFVLAAPRELGPGPERDNVIRMTRGGPQRLDAADAISHEYDVTEPVVGLAADSPLAVAARLTVDAPPGGAVMPAEGLKQGPFSESVLLPHVPTHSPVLARPHQPDLGRAPPSA